MATYIVDSTGQNDAELIGDFTTDAVAQTVTFNAGTDGEAKPLKALETTRQWLIVEVRAIGGIVGVIGKHVYSEDVTDIQTRVEAIRQEMIALHSTFVISATHYKTGDVVDVYRGFEDTAISLAPGDTNIAFTPPAVWVIDDTTHFAPTTPIADDNIIADSGFDNAGDWTIAPSGMTVSGSKLNMVDSNGRATATLTTPIEAGATYELSVDRQAYTTGNFRFEIGNANDGYYNPNTGVKTAQIVALEDGANVSIRCINGMNATFDDFTCTRV